MAFPPSATRAIFAAGGESSSLEKPEAGERLPGAKPLAIPSVKRLDERLGALGDFRVLAGCGLAQCGKRGGAVSRYGLLRKLALLPLLGAEIGNEFLEPRGGGRWCVPAGR